MFVRESTYRQLQQRYKELDRANDVLLDKWNALVRQINAKGGALFLEEGSVTPTKVFTNAEVRKLLQLCHPDKHDGKPMAVEMTQKLLTLL